MRPLTTIVILVNTSLKLYGYGYVCMRVCMRHLKVSRICGLHYPVISLPSSTSRTVVLENRSLRLETPLFRTLRSTAL